MTSYVSTNHNVIIFHPRGDGYELSWLLGWTSLLVCCADKRASKACVSCKSCISPSWQKCCTVSVLALVSVWPALAGRMYNGWRCWIDGAAGLMTMDLFLFLWIVLMDGGVRYYFYWWTLSDRLWCICLSFIISMTLPDIICLDRWGLSGWCFRLGAWSIYFFISGIFLT